MIQCDLCGDTGWISEHESETGFVDIACPECHGVDGEQPDVVTEAHDALTEDDIEVERYTQHGLDAAGFLLLAEGHLRKAKEILDQEPLRRTIYDARHDTMRATNLVKHARKLLEEQKEEPCKP